MSTFNAISVHNTDVQIGVIDTVTISGVVEDNAGTPNPLQREIVVYKYPVWQTPHKTMSDPSDGSWSITLNGGINDRYIALSIGGSSDENTEVFDYIVE